ncbi:MAG: hypothetical protein LBU40_06300 [Methanobrevibacter sp.]|jgi:hypothetical protein|nr:hypothetical protein [Methanobrevibacter sp.]
MSTWSELYEKVQRETEASKQSFKEYKKTRKTFTELFDKLQEEDENSEESDNIEKVEESIKTFKQLYEENSTQIKEQNTYNNLYEQYQSEMQPLTEQEAIYLIAKIESGEKLTESELQRLEEANTVNWSLGRALQGGLAKMTGIGNTARLRAYQAARQQGKLQGKARADQQAAAWANNKYGGQLVAGARDNQNLENANNNNVMKFNQQTGKYEINTAGMAPAKAAATLQSQLASGALQIGALAAGGAALAAFAPAAATAIATAAANGATLPAITGLIAKAGTITAGVGLAGSAYSGKFDQTNQGEKQAQDLGGTATAESKGTATSDQIKNDPKNGSPTNQQNDQENQDTKNKQNT